DRGMQAIGAVLSGTGTDGALGIKEIKANDGITFAQLERSCKYPGMPHSAIVTGCIDFALEPQNIAREINRISGYPRLATPDKYVAELPKKINILQKIFATLKKEQGVDFTNYKRNTISRRIARRMVLRKTENL